MCQNIDTQNIATGPEIDRPPNFTIVTDNDLFPPAANVNSLLFQE